MRSIDPTPGKIKHLLSTLEIDKPILMLNLLRYNEKANYPEDSQESECTGAEAYQRYSDIAFPKLEAAGAVMHMESTVLSSVIAPSNEEWDKFIIIKWPSLQVFIDVIMTEEYQAGTQHRKAALMDSRLIMLDA